MKEMKDVECYSRWSASTSGGGVLVAQWDHCVEARSILYIVHRRKSLNRGYNASENKDEGLVE